MPHCIVEYTSNLGEDAQIRPLLKKLAAKFRDSEGVFPTGGIRVRAIRLDEYVVADGEADDAFVNVMVKIGSGRDPAFKERFFGEMFEMIKAHFEPVFETRSFALSMYVEEADKDGSYKENNIHARLKHQP
ncbi:5-carboxymethyl-2-hydroxymuconate Delta-isomerase [Paraburkholderia sp. Ac-20347]|uniref:5-carboxymethyl-2-hydroxymuconate Delta-isomerase n=1 Tax=Paraburkholderia sp. Ac-20347 TaxID=2703892 RepID=UPI0019817646|nr:5-carboxymethyl-2-hydroxymuconate Delta-isomerase [Paraburkholderia sp. Ac-20347]MBN3813744.1 5-carboxymethyl-2-hydroxymuconate isomerase [Paraburkholderia sp. Ac-20347]